MTAPAVATLWLVAIYLVALGLTVLLKPHWARRFLSGFAQTTAANLLESAIRLLVGMAFIAASGQTRNSIVAVTIGLFLAGSALLMALLPGLHRSFATKSTTSVFRMFPLFGLASLALAAILMWFIA